ncbi:MAG: hypothetical protein ACXAC8_05750 [Candidatus Hodarchaeales archaeon]|jgi:DNA-binding transcriptional regulator GbsR (MarR family)
MFEIRRSFNFGRIFALMYLKARTKEKGLDQQQITTIINGNFPQKVSVSTVSRTLSKMVKSKYCDYTEESGRGKRKYFAKTNFTDLAIERIQINIEEGRNLVRSLEEIAEIIQAEDDPVNYRQLFETINELKTMYLVTQELYEDFLHRAQERLKRL